jgi:catechol 2,3-dioxygenase-like lactoylglutathione lyase family enzyme
MIVGINHVGISVENLERSISFYRDMLDMELTVGPLSVGGELYERILDLKEVSGRAALITKAGLQLELFEFSHPPPRPQDPRNPVSNRGLSHFCIEVTDLDQTYQRLKGAGVTFHCPPLDFSGKVKATYARDPDGNVFELLQHVGGTAIT